MKKHSIGGRKFPSLLIGVITVIVMAALLIPLAGCGPSEETGNISQEEVVLRVGSTKAYKTINRFSDYWYNVLSQLTTYDRLVQLDSNMNFVPWLATKWTTSTDGKTFTFTITDKATWHDGEPLTAEDIKFSIEYYRDKVSGAGWMKEVISSVEVSGNNVVINLTKPYGSLLTELQTYSIIPKHIWENVNDPSTYNGSDAAIGSGPFKLETWDQTAGKFTFVANDDYFQGKPNVDRLVVEAFKNMDALVMALSRGDIDTWWDYSGEFPYTYVPTLLKSGDIEFASATFLGVPAALGFNLDRSPMDQIEFRQAVAKAINYQEIINLVFYGYGTVPTYGFVSSSHVNFNTAIPTLGYDKQAAGALLDTLGIQDTNGNGIREAVPGKDLILTMLTRTDQTSIVRCSELVKTYLKAIGIEIELKAVDSATWTTIKDKMEYDIVLFRATPWGTLMHAGHGSGYFDSRRTGAGVLHNLDAQEYLNACDARLAAVDPAEQRALDLQIQALNQKYLPGIALAWIDSIYPYRQEWENWVVDHIDCGLVNNFSWFTVTKSTN